jgi:SAM-dependent methyltransferase
MKLESLNESSRISKIKKVIQTKEALRYFYSSSYEKYRQCLQLCPAEGLILEIGSGAGFAKELIPELCSSDIIPYPNIDKVVDATHLDFEDNSLRAIFLLNTFHHIPDVDKFLIEACRCLKPGGRILIIDQHVGLISRFVLKYLHHEPFNPKSETWSFQSSGPLSGANGALAWIVFERDKASLRKRSLY